MSIALHDYAPEADFLAARQGDRAAFTRLVRATQRMVASVALAVTRDVQLSEDIAQETYVKAWLRLSAIKHPDSFLPWLRDVTRNSAIDHVRRRRYQEFLPGGNSTPLADAPDGDASPEELIHKFEQSALLARALDEIPDQSREALLLFYREGESSRQVALLLGLSDGAVRKRLQRARQALHSELLAQIGDAARSTAPGVAFTTTVAATLATGSAKAVAAGSASATVGKWALGAIGSAFAALAVVLAAVSWEVRRYVRRARNPQERRELVRHGFAYGMVMSSFVGVLVLSKHGEWSFMTTLTVSAAYSLVIIAMGIRRHRIHSRHRHESEAPR
jgi:RNA polymerase sigma factor (sigma-70 family)